MVERSLSMREVPGSIPGASKNFFGSVTLVNFMPSNTDFIHHLSRSMYVAPSVRPLRKPCISPDPESSGNGRTEDPEKPEIAKLENGTDLKTAKCETVSENTKDRLLKVLKDSPVPSNEATTFDIKRSDSKKVELIEEIINAVKPIEIKDQKIAKVDPVKTKNDPIQTKTEPTKEKVAVNTNDEKISKAGLIKTNDEKVETKGAQEKIVKNEVPKVEKEESKVEIKEPVKIPVKNVKIQESGKTNVVFKGILETVKIGDILAISAEFEGKKSPANFIATVNDDAVLDVIMSLENFGKIARKLDSSKIKIGQSVIAFSKEMETFGRNIVIGKQNNKFELYNLDLEDTLMTDELFEMPEDIAKHPSILVLCKVQGLMEKPLENMVKTIFETAGEIKTKVTKILPKTSKGEVMVEAVFLEPNGKELVKYIIKSWTSCDPKVPKALGEYSNAI